MTNPFRPTGKQRFDLQIREYRLASTVTTRCFWCDDWVLTGTLAETAPAYLEHRAAAHPELPKPRTRIQLKAGGWQTGVKRIDDNIAAARKVGAGRNTA